MSINLYWPVYLNLEKEVIALSENIHIDDNQLSVYSIKIAELLLRTCVEVESLSKELYFQEGGTKANDNGLFFDTDCIQLLVDKWLINKRKLIISHYNFHFNIESNRIITPLNKCNKKGSSSSKWLQAYQAVKHNRVESLKFANLKNLLNALGALFILNLYFKNEEFDFRKKSYIDDINSMLSSNLFSVLVYSLGGYTFDDKLFKVDEEKICECVYINEPDFKTHFEVKRAVIDSINFAKRKHGGDPSNNFLPNEMWKEIFKDFKPLPILGKSIDNLKYRAILNKNQNYSIIKNEILNP